MHAQPRSHLFMPIVGAVVLALALMIVWAAAPEIILVPVLLVVVAAELILYGVLYALQRRRHW
jgi:uncharacterized membrane protein